MLLVSISYQLPIFPPPALPTGRHLRQHRQAPAMLPYLCLSAFAGVVRQRSTSPATMGNPCTADDVRVSEIPATTPSSALLCRRLIRRCTATINLPLQRWGSCTADDVQTMEACDNSIVCRVPCHRHASSVVHRRSTCPQRRESCTANDVQTVEACDNSVVCVPCAGTPVQPAPPRLTCPQ